MTSGGRVSVSVKNSVRARSRREQRRRTSRAPPAPLAPLAPLAPPATLSAQVTEALRRSSVVTAATSPSARGPGGLPPANSRRRGRRRGARDAAAGTVATDARRDCQGLGGA